MKKKLRGAVVPMIAVDREDTRPLHRQIYDAFRSMILERRLEPGQRIPSTRALGADLGISRIPVLDAYAQLLAEGYIESQPGAGTYVTSSLPDQTITAATSTSPIKHQPHRAVSDASNKLSVKLPWLYRSGAFSVGELAYDHFPFRIWSQLITRHVRRTSASSMNYSDPMGLKEFREVIAAYLRTARAAHCDASQIMVVNGSQQALSLAARVLHEAGSGVWVEEPSYVLLRDALTLAGCRLVPVPVDNEGLNVAAGMKLAKRARAAFVTPSHQYPLGVTMSVTRRLELLDWANRFDSWIVEDDYDSEYRYESMPIACLQGLDLASRVIYIGTFSKTLFPALRLGYIVIPPALVDRFLAVRRASDLCPAHLYQAALADFISEGHFAAHIRRTKRLYSERRSALVEALRRELSGEIEILGAEAGMHLVVTLPSGVSDVAISQKAAQEGLWLWPLSRTYLGKNVRPGFILGFGSTKAEEMPREVRRLRRFLAKESG